MMVRDAAFPFLRRGGWIGDEMKRKMGAKESKSNRYASTKSIAELCFIGLTQQKQLEADRTEQGICSIVQAYLDGKILIGLPSGLNVKLDVVNIIFTVEIITFMQLRFSVSHWIPLLDYKSVKIRANKNLDEGEDDVSDSSVDMVLESEEEADWPQVEEDESTLEELNSYYEVKDFILVKLEAAGHNKFVYYVAKVLCKLEDEPEV
ncbi:hypothetical protein FQA39_LY15122 [Lamprigera yunnana]|nr:hypothetical protein FQA39_LY15122 [Lamprigera yunnana]